MKKFLYIFIFAAAITSQINCTGNAANNTNQNTNSAATPTPAANTNANANTAVAAETPLPQFTDANVALAEGVKLLDSNSTEKAIDAFSQAIKLNPDLAEAHFRLGIAYALVEAEKDEETESDTMPTPTPTPIRKGKTLEPAKKDSEKSFENAVKAYKKYLIKNPKDDTAHFNLGRAYNKLNDDKEALKSLQQAVKLKADDTEYQTELGAIYIKLAQYDEAVRALKKALEIDDSNLEAEALLEKADAGKKRVDFGAKQKTSQMTQSAPPPETRSSRPRTTTKPAQNDTPPPPPMSAPKPESPKVDKKGNP
jgi:tetratricopeptide (TPR) repeat protein